MELLQTMKRQAQGHRKIISDLIDTIVEAIQEEDDTEIYIKRYNESVEVS